MVLSPNVYEPPILKTYRVWVIRNVLQLLCKNTCISVLTHNIFANNNTGVA